MFCVNIEMRWKFLSSYEELVGIELLSIECKMSAWWWRWRRFAEELVRIELLSKCLRGGGGDGEGKDDTHRHHTMSIQFILINIISNPKIKGICKYRRVSYHIRQIIFICIRTKR